MWHYLFIKPKTPGVSAEQTLADLKAEFPTMTSSIELDDASVSVIPATVTDDQAAIIKETNAIGGSGTLQWVLPWMLADYERGYRSNAARRKALPESLSALQAILKKASEE